MHEEGRQTSEIADGGHDLKFDCGERWLAAACAKSSSTTGGIQKVEQTAPLRDGPAAWRGIFPKFRQSRRIVRIPKKKDWSKFSKFSNILSKVANFLSKITFKNQQVLTKLLRSEKGAKECIV